MSAKVIDKTIVIDPSLLSDDIINVIDLSRKRVFHKTIDRFAESMATAIKIDNSFAQRAMEITESIRNGDYENTLESKQELARLVDLELCRNDAIIDYIRKTVNAEYKITINSDTEKESPIMFTDKHAKLILCCSMMSRMVFPVLSEFLVTHSLRKEEDLFLESMFHIMDIFSISEEGDHVDLSAKLQNYALVSTQTTLYSDQVIWNYLKNVSIDEISLAITIHRDILTNIIPKLEANRSVVSLIHVVTKNKIDYQFTSKLSHSFRPIKRIQSGEDESYPFSKIEANLSRTRDELSLSMMQIDIENYVNKHNVLTDDELDYHLENVVLHTAQQTLLSFYLTKFLGRGIPIAALTRIQYTKLLFIVKEWFEDNGYTFVPYILLGIPMVKTSIRRNLGRGKVFSEIIGSKSFKRIRSQFKFMGEEKITDLDIIKLLGDIINTDFEFYTLMDGSEFAPKGNGDIRVAMSELLQYIESL